MSKALAAFALGAFLVSVFPLQADSDCVADGARSTVHLAKVIDGDTLALSDGRRVRLIGVNTPELGGGSAAAQPGAQRARQFSQDFLAAANRIEIVTGGTDRYGRTLAHVYRNDGDNLEVALLRAGLAQHVVVPPNVSLAPCLGRAEQEARRARAGLWAEAAFAPLDVSRLVAGANGYHLLRGRVSAVKKSRASWWVEVDGRVSLRVARDDQHYFDWAKLEALSGREVEVRGWLIWRDRVRGGHPPWMMALRHPEVLQVLR